MLRPKKVRKGPLCFHPGSNWGSPACQADGLTNFPMKAQSCFRPLFHWVAPAFLYTRRAFCHPPSPGVAARLGPRLSMQNAVGSYGPMHLFPQPLFEPRSFVLLPWQFPTSSPIAPPLVPLKMHRTRSGQKSWQLCLPR